MALLAATLACTAGAAGLGVSPEAGQASAGAITTVLSEDFESWPPPSWVLSADPQTGGVWKSLDHPAGCASGSSFPYSNATGGAGLCADANSDCLGDGMDTTMVTPSFSLASPAYLSAQLQFKSDFFSAAALDEAWVDITTDGGAVWTNLLYFDHQSVRGPDTETIDLTPYLGQPDVRLSFEYTAPGWDWAWQVDDVAVTAVQQEPCTITCTTTVPASAAPGGAVSFSATATPSAGCSGTPSFSWTFGDGQSSTGQNPSHTYASAGVFDWTLVATQNGASCTKTGTLTVTAPPVVSLMKKVAPPFRIVVTGSNLQNGIAVAIDGAAWTSVVWKNTTRVVLKGALKSAIPKGVVKTFRFVNPDGGETTMIWSW
jgi:PKD repeat protein